MKPLSRRRMNSQKDANLLEADFDNCYAEGRGIKQRRGAAHRQPPSIGTSEFLRFVPHHVSTVPDRRRPRALASRSVVGSSGSDARGQTLVRRSGSGPSWLHRRSLVALTQYAIILDSVPQARG